MASESLQVIITGHSHALVNEMRKVGAEAEKTGASLHQNMAKVGGIALAAVAGAAIAVGASSMKMADEFETAHARLSVALKNTGSSFAQQGKQIDAASAAGAKFGYTRTQIEDALATMTRGMGSSEKALHALGIAQDLAAATGKPLEQAALAVTRASEGQLRPLKMLGIDLPIAAGGALKTKVAFEKLGAAQEALKTVQDKVHGGILKGLPALAALETAQNKVKDAQEHFNTVSHTGTDILQQLGDKLKGSSATAADTFGGKVKALHAMMGNLQITIGLALIPIITKLATVVMGAVGWFQKHKDIAMGLGVVLGTVAATLMAVYVAEKIMTAGKVIATVATNAFKLATAGLNLVMSMNPIMAVVAALAILVAGVIYAYGHFKWFHNAVQKVWEIMQSGFGWIRDHWPLILGILTGPFGIAVLLIVNNWNGIIGFFKKIPGWIASAFSSLWDIITSPFRDAFNEVMRLFGPIKTIIDAVTGFFNSNAGKSSQFAQQQAGGTGPLHLSKAGTWTTVPGAAAGGIFPARPGGHLINIAEGGQDEAVIPLSRAGGLGGGNLTIHNHFDGVMIGPESGLDHRVAKTIVNQIVQWQRRGGGTHWQTVT